MNKYSRKHIGISLITNDVRTAGKCYRITTDLRSYKIQFLDDNDKIWSSYKDRGWKFIKAK